MQNALILTALVLFSSLAPAAQEPAGETTAQSATKEARPLERVFVAGASVSNGFGLTGKLKAPIKLAHIFEAACAAEGASFTALGDSRFFLDPRGAGERIIDTVIEGEATCFIGVDFLFWYAYGMKSEARRIKDFDLALEELERLKCPVLVGDMPDMSIALKGKYFGRPMITVEMIPAEETLVTINARLKAWVKERKGAAIVPLSAMMEQIQAGETIELRGLSYTPEELPTLLQGDLLHLTAAGSMALCLLVGDLLVREHEEIVAADFVFDRAAAMQRLSEVAARLRESEEAAREARRERRRREREERRKKRDEEEEPEEQRAPLSFRASS